MSTPRPSKLNVEGTTADTNPPYNYREAIMDLLVSSLSNLHPNMS